MIQTLIGRSGDLDYVRRTVAQGACCSVVGTSNLGKSALLRELGESTPTTTGTFVYIDCNQMVEQTVRALFTVTWRVVAARLERQSMDREDLASVSRWTDELVHAPTPLAAQSAFEDGLAFALARLPRPLVLCLDEFDQVYQSVEAQAFLNLRALQDRYGPDLLYVTATERELARLTTTREQGEFYELVAGHVHFIPFWNEADTRRFCEQLAQREHVTFDERDIAFIYANAGGHPGLTQAACFILARAIGAPGRDQNQDRVIHPSVQAELLGDENVRAECQKIWDDLEVDEREALLNLPSLEGDSPTWRGLRAKDIVREAEKGPVVFGRLFADFIRRQQLKQQPNGHGVYIDVDAGAVWVNGRAIESLSDLEYRLLVFLYGRLDRICDKYGIVEAVWGQDYMDKVDDTRIEKLVSRVRQKIEPDPAHPRYLLSLRGRGYKLVR